MKDQTRRKLVLLVMAHVAAVFAFSTMDVGLTASVISDALRSAQTGLLPFWLVMGTCRWPLRLLTFVAGTAALYGWDWHYTLSSFDWIDILFIGGTELVVAVALLLARHGPPKLHLTQTNEPMMSGTRLQFSLRQMMAVVVVVAVVVAVARPIRSFVLSKINLAESDEVRFADDSGGDVIMALFEGCMCIGAVIGSSIAAWASICSGRPGARGILALVLAISVGLVFTYVFVPVSENVDDDRFYFSMLLTGQAFFTMASLLVVRSCGYRLVSRSTLRTRVSPTSSESG